MNHLLLSLSLLLIIISLLLMRMLIFTPLLYWTFSPEHLFTFFVFFHQWAPVHSEPALHPSRRLQKPYQVCTQVWLQTFPTLTPLTRAKQIRQTVSVTSQSSTPNNKSSRHLWWQFGRWEPRKSMCKQFKMFFFPRNRQIWEIAKTYLLCEIIFILTQPLYA